MGSRQRAIPSKEHPTISPRYSGHGDTEGRVALSAASSRLLRAIPIVTLLATMGGAGSAFAQCTTVVTPLCASQGADQTNLLSRFNLLLRSPAGVAVLNANLQTEENIYLNSSQARRSLPEPY